MREASGVHLLEADPLEALALWDLERATIAPGRTGVAAVFERIEGQHPDDDDVIAVEAAGEAFAQLDKVLATMTVARGPWDGGIESVHPLVSDLSSLDELGSDGADFVRRMAGAPSRLRATIPPRQVIHGDFAFGNVLAQALHLLALPLTEQPGLHRRSTHSSPTLALQG